MFTVSNNTYIKRSLILRRLANVHCTFKSNYVYVNEIQENINIVYRMILGKVYNNIEMSRITLVDSYFIVVLLL